MEYIELLVNILSVVGAFAVTSATLPKKTKHTINKYMPVLALLIEVLGANVGNAKNKD